MTARMPVAVVGAGAVGRMHIERLMVHGQARLAGIADPGEAGRDLARQLGVPWHADPLELLANTGAQAVVVATPNGTHADIGVACLERKLPVLMEKPIADTLENARRLCDAMEATGVPVLVGHQRRHNPLLRRAQTMVREGVLGRPVAATVMATWLKPDSYFEMQWRRLPGGGPVLINMIHDIDLLRFLLGEVVSVQAQCSSAVRGFAVEDTAAALLRFESGALATLITSDAVAAPWNWDLAAGEASHYAKQDVDSIFIAGTDASLTLPQLQVFRFHGQRGWHEPLTQERTPLHKADPFAEQLRHLRAVVEGRETPVCSARDGLRTLETTLAVHEAAHSGGAVSLAH